MFVFFSPETWRCYQIDHCCTSIRSLPILQFLFLFGSDLICLVHTSKWQCYLIELITGPCPCKWNYYLDYVLYLDATLLLLLAALHTVISYPSLVPSIPASLPCSLSVSNNSYFLPDASFHIIHISSMWTCSRLRCCSHPRYRWLGSTLFLPSAFLLTTGLPWVVESAPWAVDSAPSSAHAFHRILLAFVASIRWWLLPFGKHHSAPALAQLHC